MQQVEEIWPDSRLKIAQRTERYQFKQIREKGDLRWWHPVFGKKMQSFTDDKV